MTRTARSLAGTWHNERGSELRLEVDPAGELRGGFRPGDGAGAGETFPVAGFSSGNLVAFTVDFGKLGSLTSWVGHLIVDAGPQLEMLWQMTLEQPHPRRAEERWKTIWSGADRFSHGAAPKDAARRQPLLPLWPL